MNRACVDCKHHSDPWWLMQQTNLCKHPANTTTKAYFDPVRGHIPSVRQPNICEWCREEQGSCGLEGKLWEPSLWLRIKMFIRYGVKK